MNKDEMSAHLANRRARTERIRQRVEDDLSKTFTPEQVEVLMTAVDEAAEVFSRSEDE